jgi:hypothetical protein
MAFSNDGHGTAIMDTANDVLTGDFKIKQAVWAGFTNAADDLILTYRSGKPLVTLKSGVASGPLEIKALANRWVKDLLVDTIDAGKLYIYYE